MDGQNFGNDQNQNTGNQYSGSQYNNYQDNMSNSYYGAPGQGQPGQSTSGVQVAGLVLGILSIVTCCFYGVPGLILGIIGLVCAIKGRKHSRSGIGTAGLVCSIIGLVFSVISTIYWAICFKLLFDLLREYPDLLSRPEILEDPEALMRLLLEYYGR